MRAAIPTELLLRLLSATPAQYAAVAKILGVSADPPSHEAMADEGEEDEEGGNIEPPTSNFEHRTRVSEEVARSAFALLHKLDLDAPQKAPSALTVFRLYCVEGYSADQVGRKCRCGKATVIRRLRFIEARTGVRADQFRAMSGHLQKVDDEIRASGAREIYRRGLVDED